MNKHIGAPPKSPNARRVEMRRLDFSSKDMRSRTKPKRRTRPEPAQQYPAGYFTELIRRHNWPPMFEAAPLEIKPSETLVAQIAHAARRSHEAQHGIGWAAGTVSMPGTPHANSRPEWMR
jgi:hypothetical protein